MRNNSDGGLKFQTATIGEDYFVLLANDLRRKPGPVYLVVIHAVVAAVAFTLVLLVAKG